MIAAAAVTAEPRPLAGAPSDTTRQRLAFADAIRATAIFAVVFHHLVYTTRPTVGHERPFVLGYFGVWGVNCFFVLSGYLLGRPYLAALIDPDRSFPSTRLFLMRRFLRIYPLYAVAILFSIGCALAQHGTFPSALDIAAHLTMLHTLSVATATSLNGPLWTMAVDAEFYLALPAAAFLAAQVLRGKTRRFRIVSIFAMLAALVIASLAYRYIVFMRHPEAVRDFAAGVVFVRNVVGFAGTFALGMALALVTMLARDRLRGHTVLYTGFVVFGFLLALSQLAVRVEQSSGPIATGAVLRLTFMEVGAALSVSLILFGLAEGTVPWLMRLAQTKAVMTAAALAYAVYLFHFPIIEGVALLLHAKHGNEAFLEVSAVSLLLIVPVAFAAHYWIERPFLNMKDALREKA